MFLFLPSELWDCWLVYKDISLWRSCPNYPEVFSFRKLAQSITEGQLKTLFLPLVTMADVQSICVMCAHRCTRWQHDHDCSLLIMATLSSPAQWQLASAATDSALPDPQFKHSLFECTYGRRRIWNTFVWRHALQICHLLLLLLLLVTVLRFRKSQMITIICALCSTNTSNDAEQLLCRSTVEQWPDRTTTSHHSATTTNHPEICKQNISNLISD